MKFTTSSMLALVLGLLISFNASAWWGNNGWGNNGWGNNGWGGNGWNNWPVWTPMYWMEEMSDSWDDDGWGGNRWGPNPYGYGPYSGYGPYGYSPYGYGSYGGYGPYGYGQPFPPYGVNPEAVAPPSHEHPH